MALAIDSSTPALASANSGNVATTASFTPPAGAVLVAIGYHDTVGGNTTNTSAITDSQGLTWSIKATRNRADSGGQNGHVQISTAVVGSSTSMTVTTTGTNCGGAAGVYVLVMTGADTTTPMDATPTEGSNTAAAISLAITTVTDLAWAFLVATDWNVAANMTAGASQTAVVATGIGSGPDMRVYLGRQNSTTSPAGSVTMSTASPSAGNTNNYIVFAVRPATGGGTTYNQSVSGGITPAGALVRQDNKVLAGGATPGGTLNRSTAKRPSGGLTPAGAVTRQAGKPLIGAATPTGAVAKQIGKSASGTLTPAGSLVTLKAVVRAFAGSLTPAGALARQTGKALTGVLAPAGTVRRSISKLLTGTIAGAGSVARQTAKRFLGSLTPSGSVATSTGPPAPVRDLELTVGAPRTRWTTGLPTVSWSTDEPHPKWTTGLPEV